MRGRTILPRLALRGGARYDLVMRAVEWVGRVTDWWMPDVSDPELRARVRFAIQSWFIAWPMAVVWTLLFTVMGIWLQVALNGLMVLMGPLTLWGLRRTGKLTPWVQLTLGGALLLYGPGVLAQTPIDETGLFFSVIVPLVAGFTFGGRSAARWAVITAAVSVGALWFGQHGYSVPVTDSMPFVSKSLNLITTLAMTALFAGRFYAVRHFLEAKDRESVERALVLLADLDRMQGFLGFTPPNGNSAQGEKR